MSKLFVRLPNHIGDACMAMPALDLLEAAGFSLYLVGKSFVGELFQGTPRRFDPIEGSVLNDIRRIKELAATVDHPKGLLLPNSFGSALLFRWAGIQCTGLATDGRSPLLAHAIPEPPKMHEVERFWYVAYEALKAWGITPPYHQIPPQLNMKLAKRNEAGARNLIDRIQLPEKFAILAPIAKGRHEGKAKYWRHFNELVEPLKARGLTPVIFPAEDEYEASRLSCPDANIYEPTSIGNFASLCSKASVVIANDSGVSHIAAAVHAPQVTIVGVTDVERTRPWNDLNVTVGKKGKWPDTQEVVEAIDKALEKGKDK
ncbi:MAG: glycosyltransferase family 9 protein [Burkholderiales bacterium]|nr:glycosyltransferase family 9 protein [Burkholderiales bacterium]